MATDRAYYTPRDLHLLTGVKIDVILGWIHSGDLTAHNLAADAGGRRPRWRIAIAEWERFLASREARKPEAPRPVRRQRPKPTRQWV